MKNNKQGVFSFLLILSQIPILFLDKCLVGISFLTTTGDIEIVCYLKLRPKLDKKSLKSWSVRKTNTFKVLF